MRGNYSFNQSTAAKKVSSVVAILSNWCISPSSQKLIIKSVFMIDHTGASPDISLLFRQNESYGVDTGMSAARLFTLIPLDVKFTIET